MSTDVDPGATHALSAAPDTVEVLPPARARLVLVRHGESTWNQEHRFQGQLDPPLTERGLEQARRLAARLAGTRFVASYTSDLVRARQTAAPAEEVLEMRAEPLTGLREIALGEWEGLRRDDVIAGYPEQWAAWSRGPSWDIVPGGEGAAPFEERVRSTIEGLFERHPRGDVLCVTHGGVIQAALAAVVGHPLDGIFPFVIGNASLTVLQRSAARTVVTAVNDSCHLPAP